MKNAKIKIEIDGKEIRFSFDEEKRLYDVKPYDVSIYDVLDFMYVGKALLEHAFEYSVKKAWEHFKEQIKSKENEQ